MAGTGRVPALAAVDNHLGAPHAGLHHIIEPTVGAIAPYELVGAIFGRSAQQVLVHTTNLPRPINLSADTGIFLGTLLFSPAFAHKYDRPGANLTGHCSLADLAEFH